MGNNNIIKKGIGIAVSSAMVATMMIPTSALTALADEAAIEKTSAKTETTFNTAEDLGTGKIDDKTENDNNKYADNEQIKDAAIETTYPETQKSPSTETSYTETAANADTDESPSDEAVTVGTADELAEAIKHVSDTGAALAVTLSADLETPSYVLSAGNITINGAGHTITQTSGDSAFTINNNASMILENITITTTKTCAALIFTAGNADLTLGSGCTLTGSYSTYHPGAVYVTKNACVTMNPGATITDCHNTSTSTTGGVSIIDQGLFVMEGGTISNCSGVDGGAVTISTNWGGPTASDGSGFVMNGGLIENCTGGDLGGGAVALYTSNAANITMTGGTIRNCTAGGNGYGGGIFAFTSGVVNIEGGTIENNSASNGGGIFMYSGTLNVSGGTITENTATVYGGAIYSKTEAHISGGTISNNTSAKYGGAMYTEGAAAVELSGAQVINNAANCGGGLFAGGSSFNVTASATITGNHADSMGGGLFSYKGTNSVASGVKVYDNSSVGTGSDVCVQKTSTLSLGEAAIGAELACGGKIDAWYLDSNTKHWNHSHFGEFCSDVSTTNNITDTLRPATYASSTFGVKAAHGETYGVEVVAFAKESNTTEDDYRDENAEGFHLTEVIVYKHLAKGDTVPSFEPPAIQGYKFVGWKDEKPADTSMIAENAVYTALYAPLSVFTVTYTDGMDGEIFADQVMSFFEGEDVPPFEGDIPCTESFVFANWTQTIDANGNITRTANWGNAEDAIAVPVLENLEDGIAMPNAEAPKEEPAPISYDYKINDQEITPNTENNAEDLAMNNNEIETAFFKVHKRAIAAAKATKPVPLEKTAENETNITRDEPEASELVTDSPIQINHVAQTNGSPSTPWILGGCSAAALAVFAALSLRRQR